MYFDHVEEREENGSFYIVAIDTQSGNSYLVNNHSVIQTSTSSLEGFKLVISAYPDTYVYRGTFQSKEEMEKLSKEIGKLIMSADYKTNSIFHT